MGYKSKPARCYDSDRLDVPQKLEAEISRSDVETELHHVAVLDHIVLALDA